jgi:hypothetical protein
MPNGMEISDEEFARLNKPLLGVDALWNRFAAKIGGRIIYNYHNRPERRAVVQDPDGLRRQVTLGVVTGASDGEGRALGVVYDLDVWAYYDTDCDRTWWVEKIDRLSASGVTPGSLEPLLDRAWERLRAVDHEFLRTHGEIATAPPGRAAYPKNRYVEHPSEAPDDREFN